MNRSSAQYADGSYGSATQGGRCQVTRSAGITVTQAQSTRSLENEVRKLLLGLHLQVQMLVGLPMGQAGA